VPTAPSARDTRRRDRGPCRCVAEIAIAAASPTVFATWPPATASTRYAHGPIQCFGEWRRHSLAEQEAVLISKPCGLSWIGAWQPSRLLCQDVTRPDRSRQDVTRKRKDGSFGMASSPWPQRYPSLQLLARKCDEVDRPGSPSGRLGPARSLRWWDPGVSEPSQCMMDAPYLPQDSFF
jgi:hypothetical protein